MVWSIMTIFSITQPFLDGSFSSSNSTEILMRQFCAQNFSSIGCNCEELSCKRTDGRTAGRTHWPILECTHFLSTQKRTICFYGMSFQSRRYVYILKISFRFIFNLRSPTHWNNRLPIMPQYHLFVRLTVNMANVLYNLFAKNHVHSVGIGYEQITQFRWWISKEYLLF
jgi:hypothetical protein